MGFDAASEGAEALSSRTGVTMFTLSAVQDCSRQSPSRMTIALYNWFGPIIQVSRGGTDDDDERCYQLRWLTTSRVGRRLGHAYLLSE